MRIINGNLWDSKDDIILVTANSYINSRGELVMGRGAALELKNKRKDLPYLFADGIKNICGHLGRYGIIYELILPAFGFVKARQVYGIFQVKYHFRANADLRLIKYSTFKLWELLNGVLFDKTVSINFPGIGYGHLKYEDVLPTIDYLDNNVTFYLRDI